MRLYLSYLTAIILLLASCQDYDGEWNEETTASRIERSDAWEKVIGGKSDPNQTWIAGRSVLLDVVTPEQSTILVYSIGGPQRVLYAQQTVDGAAQIPVALTADGSSEIGIECRMAATTRYHKVTLNGKSGQHEVVDFTANDTRADHSAADNCSAHPDNMCSTANHAAGYTSWGPWTWQMLSEALPESKVPKADRTATNYRLISKGKFYISMLYGYTGTPDNCYFGYYYYSQSDYSDVQFVEFAEVLNSDYYVATVGGQQYDYAKVRYQLASDQVWRDASFDHYSQPDREKDRVRTNWRKAQEHYNTNYLYNTHKNDLSAVKGISFRIEAPKDKFVGFYLLRTNRNAKGSESDLLKAYLASAVNTSRSKPLTSDNCIINFTDKDQDYEHSNGNKETNPKYQFGSAVSRWNGYTFIGMDDNPRDGDHDSNDVTFAITAGIDGIDPDVQVGDIVFPDVYDKDVELYYNPDGTKGAEPIAPEVNEPVVDWTIAFEDMGTTVDFDFNDVVIGVTPDPKGNLAHVVLKAASGTADVELHYDGPEGDVNFGNVHELMGGTLVNGGSTESADELALQDVPWPTGYSMMKNAQGTSDAARFYILVKQTGKADRRVDITSHCSVNSNGTVVTSAPEAICICSGSWEWPQESVNITSAYTGIGEWAQNQSQNADWYLTPNKNKVVKKKGQ